MLFAVLMTICAATADAGNSCDVRVKYIHNATSEMFCVEQANGIVEDIIKTKQKNDPSFYLLSSSADCHSHERIKALLNVIPDVMAKHGYTYRMSFY